MDAVPIDVRKGMCSYHLFAKNHAEQGPLFDQRTGKLLYEIGRQAHIYDPIDWCCIMETHSLYQFPNLMASTSNSTHRSFSFLNVDVCVCVVSGCRYGAI